MHAFVVRSPARRGARVGATYSIPVALLSPEVAAEEMERLTLQAKTSFGQPPPPFCAYEVVDGVLHVPRFYGLRHFGIPEHDDRAVGDAASPLLVFGGTLNEVQHRAHAALHARHYAADGDQGAIVSLPCGFGKTVLAVHEACHYGRRVFVLVHKGVIRDQWKESFERFCPGVRVGVVQGNKWEVGAEYDVVVGMVMTIAKRAIAPSAFDAFGMVVCDEAHHMAAPVMSQALKKFRARRILGLTATKDRPDGLTPMLHWALGDEGFHAARTCESVRVSIATFAGATREVLTRHGARPLIAVMLNQLAVHAARNAFLADRIAAYRTSGRVVMVLSDRLVQLDLLMRMVVARGVPAEEVGVFKGGQRDDERVAQLARPVVMCSYGMANEGVDKKEADTCVLATPKGRVTQAIGRVQRPCPGKKEPLVLDVADDVSIFPAMRWTRQRMYTKEGYAVQVLDALGAAPDAWFV